METIAATYRITTPMFLTRDPGTAELRAGALRREHPPARLSAGLEAFTGQVAATVQAHSGCVVYAGGDDAVALLP